MIEKFVAKLITLTRVDSILATTGLRELLAKAGVELNSGAFVGALIKWFLVIVFLVASFDILGLSQVNEFLRGVVLSYLPNVIAAVLILLASAIVAEFLKKVVIGSAKAAGVAKSAFLGSVTKWAIWIFAILTALTQLGIAVSIIQTVFIGVVAALALAIGLSFGLGGRDAAARAIEKMRDEVSDR
jgi:small-conductance mechanosensitive channel